LDFRSGVVGKRLIQQIACDTFGIPGNDLFEFFEDIEGPAAGQHAVDDDLDVLVVESIYRTDGSLAPSGFSLVDQGVVVVGKDSEDGHTFSHEWAYGLGFCHDCDPNNYTWGNSAQDLHLIGDEDCDTETGSRTFVKLYQPLQRLCNASATASQTHPNGNGRMGRFLLNACLIAGGYPWTTIRVDSRNQYMTSIPLSIHNPLCYGPIHHRRFLPDFPQTSTCQ